MKYWMIAGLVLSTCISKGQSIVGTWQLTEEKTCLGANIPLSETEKELMPGMGASGATVARTIKFDKKGAGEDGIFSAGRKKASDRSPFKYKVNGKELFLLDVKSGMMTESLMIDTLTQSMLKVHNSKKDCERKVFIRIK